MYLIDDEINTQKRRRRHSAEFKTHIIQICKQPGVSIAATALRYQLNANLVRTWVKAQDQLLMEPRQIRLTASVPEFISIQLPSLAKAAAMIHIDAIWPDAYPVASASSSRASDSEPV